MRRERSARSATLCRRFPWPTPPSPPCAPGPKAKAPAISLRSGPARTPADARKYLRPGSRGNWPPIFNPRSEYTKGGRMTKGRLEAFSDGVIAVIITIMVLELKVPHDADPKALMPLVPVFLSYLLSFVFVGIYWNNHHHMFHAVHHVNGATLWANLHLLFWLSLVPFVTGWMDENHFAAVTVAAYGIVLLGAACAYTILTRALLAIHAKDSPLAKALGKDFKGSISLVIYVAALPLAFVHPWIACSLYVLVAAIWLCPDRRFEKLLDESKA